MLDVDADGLGVGVLEGEHQVGDPADALGHLAHADRPLDQLREEVELGRPVARVWAPRGEAL